VGSMSGYTLQEIRDLIHEFELLEHGTKSAWFAQQPFDKWTFYRWRRSFFGGDLDRGLVPREHVVMKKNNSLRAFERARALEISDHEQEVAQLRARIEMLEGTNEALGKAIGLLHKLNEQEPDTPELTETPDSLPPKTNSSTRSSPSQDPNAKHSK